ncbi:ANK [Mytilus edulis]|uniref:ANK n=1 Tax=Mytilus edulis TaxID=6550 RepID=A0A8S3VDW6_MYTED|nr:ANK [Mytilus edulis]
MYQECQILKMKILDQSNQEIILEIKQSLEEMKELRQTIDNLGTEHAKVTENLRELQSSHSTLKTSHNTLQAEHIEVRKSLKDPIPPNIKDQFQKQIADWEKKDKILLLEWNPDPFDNTPLSTSYVNNNTRISNSPSLVQPLLKHKPDINAQTYDGGSALYFSAWNGNIEITQILVENNADCNICAHSKQSPCKGTSNHITDYISKKSIEYAFDVEAGSSPLHISCFMGWIDVVNCLIDHHANINMTKEDGTTPLFNACELGHADIVRLLLHKGADLQIGRIDEKFPLDIATDNGHTSIVLILTEHMRKRKPCPL